ncbi:GspH/FimT family pseudopilin [Rhodoferax sp.]|uniref:GspH/FimT family pseudopilin n=1 Tax=Rhodoferax sp. TaxID=50421 RepID=UPI0026083F87|nr:GspH/FimT family pseudopilin [Rhodoferax sp.]MDD5480400.1 GspH/FimT family pseudopilin [Rhodoferax sp.]
MKKYTGFTLIELMVVVAIVALMAVLAAPSFKQMIQSNAISSAVNSFMADMRFARSEAIRRGGSVVLCRSNSPEAADPNCGTGSGTAGRGWKTGWFVFHDLDGDQSKDASEPVLRAQGSLTSLDYALETSGGASSTKFRFTPTGRLVSLGASTGIQFGGAAFPTEQQRVVCISVGGRARVALDADGKATGNASCN